MRRVLPLLAVATALALAWPAGAAPSTPAPTATATFETIDPSPYAAPPPQQKQPAMTAGWSVTKPGRDATLTVSGTPVPIFTGHADALWTSAPLALTRRGKVATLAVTWKGVQYDPYSTGITSQTISVRFTDAKGRWGSFLPVVNQALTAPLDTGAQRSLTVPVMYRGPVPTKAVRFQVQVADEFTYVTQLQHTVRVTL